MPAHIKSLPRLFLLTLLSTLTLVAVAPRSAMGVDDCYRDLNDRIPCEEYEEEWKETNVVIPAVPADADFRLLAVSEANDRYHYYLAENSISRGSDGVMRYAVAVVSGSGVRNVFYEGMRCATDETKTYAYASRRGPFRRALRGRWRPVANKGVRAYQEFLRKVIICDVNGYAWEARRARQALLRQFTAGGFRRGITCRSCDNDGFIRND